MARVLIPVMPRRYNANPRGSATTTVTMAGDNPFERQVNVLNSTRSMLPGMGALGITDGPSVPTDSQPPVTPAEAAAAGVDWSKILTGLTNAGAQLAIAKLTPPLPKTTGITPIPVGGPFHMPAKSSVLPWAIGVGVVVVGLGAFLLLRRK